MATVADVCALSPSPVPPPQSPPPLPPQPSPPPSAPPLSPPPPPFGCTDSNALNFRHFAIVDDGSCEVGGCTDSALLEFNPAATYDDGSCPPVYEGCTTSAADNYRVIANVDDGSCRYAGCMDSLAYNFDASAMLPAPCVAFTVGCMQPAANNYYALANLDSGLCLYAAARIAPVRIMMLRPRSTVAGARHSLPAASIFKPTITRACTMWTTGHAPMEAAKTRRRQPTTIRRPPSTMAHALWGSEIWY